MNVVARIGVAALQLVAAATVVFVAVSLLPGDPVQTLGGGDRPLSPEARIAVERRFGLDRPAHERYATFMAGLARGDLGESYAQRRPVRSILAGSLGPTLTLALVVVAVEVVLGVFAGMVAAWRRSRWLDALLAVSVVASLAVPIYLLASVAQYGLGLRAGVLPVSGTGAGWSSWVLPALVLAAPATAWAAHVLRASMREQLGREHIRAVRAMGYPPTRVARHALRLAAVPVVTFVAVDLAALMGGAVVVESIFNIPGLGREVVDAVRVRDSATLIGLTTVLVVVVIVAHAVADVVNSVLDPRVAAAG